MHTELVQIFVGQGGAQIADACWELFTQEHFISPRGESNASLCGQEQGDFEGSTFFNLTQRGFCVPRTLIVDTEPSVIDEIRTGVYRNLFQPSSLLSGCEDSASNFARGYYGTPCSLMDASYNTIRHLVEACDMLNGIIFYRTYGGGTGSGFGCRLIQYTSEEFCKVPRMDFGVIPGVTLSSGPVEPYNAVLSLKIPVEQINLVSLVDNMALKRICSCLLKIQKPSFTSFNRILAQCVSGLTSSFRFPGPTTISMMDLYTNLVPYPDAHFAMIGFAPLFDLETASKGQIDMMRLTESVFTSENQLVHQQEESKMFLSCCLFYRGNTSVRDVNTCIDDMRSSNRLPFVDWCPTGFKVGISYQPMTIIEASRMGASETSVIALHNSTLFKTPLQIITRAAELLLRRKAFLHWYKAEGLDVDEFEGALTGLRKLEADYDSFINNSMERKWSTEGQIQNHPPQLGLDGIKQEKHPQHDTSASALEKNGIQRKKISPFCRKEYSMNYTSQWDSLRKSPSCIERHQLSSTPCSMRSRQQHDPPKPPVYTDVTSDEFLRIGPKHLESEEEIYIEADLPSFDSFSPKLQNVGFHNDHRRNMAASSNEDYLMRRNDRPSVQRNKELEAMVEADFDSFGTESRSQKQPPRRQSSRYNYLNNIERHNMEVNTQQHIPTPLPEDTSSTSMNVSVMSKSSSTSFSKLRKFLAIRSPKRICRLATTNCSSASTTANLATSLLLNEEIMRELERSVKSELINVLDAFEHVELSPPPPLTTPVTTTLESNQHHIRDRQHHHYHHHHRHHHRHSRRDRHQHNRTKMS